MTQDLYIPSITFSDDAVDSCRHVLNALTEFVVNLTIPENTGYPCEAVLIVRIERDGDVVVAETAPSGIPVPGGGTWAIPLNVIQSVEVL